MERKLVKLFYGSIAMILGVTACSLFTTKQLLKSVIDVGLATCIAEHADIQEEAALREVCRWTDELAPIVKDLLSARSKGLAAAQRKSTSGPCVTDGGK